jgi:hypothetical protein
MSKTASAEFYPVQLKEALILTQNLLRDSKCYEQEFRRSVLSSSVALYEFHQLRLFR